MSISRCRYNTFVALCAISEICRIIYLLVSSQFKTTDMIRTNSNSAIFLANPAPESLDFSLSEERRDESTAYVALCSTYALDRDLPSDSPFCDEFQNAEAHFCTQWLVFLVVRGPVIQCAHIVKIAIFFLEN